jgi:hypothetical protein
MKLSQEDDWALREALNDQQSPDEFDDYRQCAVMMTGNGKPVDNRELLVLLLLYDIRERIWARQRKIRKTFQESVREPVFRQDWAPG